MKNLLTLFLLLSSPFLLHAQSESISWLEGYWEGIGYQAPTDSKWEIELYCDALTQELKISYPTLECSGHWQLRESREGYAALVEWITEGAENCDNGVSVIVTRIDEEYVSVAYFLPELYDGVVAYSVLRKKEPVKEIHPEPDLDQPKKKKEIRKT